MREEFAIRHKPLEPVKIPVGKKYAGLKFGQKAPVDQTVQSQAQKTLEETRKEKERR